MCTNHKQDNRGHSNSAHVTCLSQLASTNKIAKSNYHQFSPCPFFPTMKATLVACNTRAHDKHPKQRKKSMKQSHGTDDDATALSVASRGSDRLKSKPGDPPLPFPTNRPVSVPPHANDSVAKVAGLLQHPITTKKCLLP